MFFFFYIFCTHRDLHVLTHSFPTRRSSDLFRQQKRQLRKMIQPAIDNIQDGALSLSDLTLDHFHILLKLLQAPDPDWKPITGLTVALDRSEEHTSELKSLMRISYAVLCLKTTPKYYKTKQHEQAETQ